MKFINLLLSGYCITIVDLIMNGQGYSFEDVMDEKMDQKLDSKLTPFHEMLSAMDSKLELMRLSNSVNHAQQRYVDRNDTRGYGNNNGNFNDYRPPNPSRGRGFRNGNGRNPYANYQNTPRDGANGFQNGFQSGFNSRGRGRFSRGSGVSRTGNGNENFQERKPVMDREKTNSTPTEDKSTGTKRKTFYTNPLLPKSSRVERIWERKEVDIFKGKFGTNAEQQYLKQFTNFAIDEAQSKTTRCSCELVIKCIPKMFGTYAQNEEHDTSNAIDILKSADKDFCSKEVLHVARHPGQENTPLNIIRVTVLFNNSCTPERIVTRAEMENDDTIFQRSIPKNIRQRNLTMGSFITNLNSLRPKNASHLWSSVILRGEVHAIKRADPTFVPPVENSEPETEEDQTNSTPAPTTPIPETEESVKKTKKGLFKAVEALKNANLKMAKYSPNPPMQNTPGLTVEEVLMDMETKHSGDMTLACQELLLMFGVPDKKNLRKRPPLSLPEN